MRIVINLERYIFMKQDDMKKSSLGCLLILCLFSNAAFSADVAKEHRSQNVKPVLKKIPLQYFGVSFENDIFFDEDHLYTHGTFVYWGYHDRHALDRTTLPSWMSFLTQYTYLANVPNKRHDISYSVGQIIQTPVEHKQPECQQDDVPFAGLFGWKGRVQSFDNVIDDQIGLTLGAVGPISEAKFTQTVIHKGLHLGESKGWENQLANELVVRLDTLRKWRLYEKSFYGTQVDFITGGGGGVGNLKSDISAGLTARWGTSLQKSYASAPLFTTQQFDGLKPSPFGWYLFTNITGSYVFNDIFMDGNTFKDSRSVDLINDQYALSFGAMVNIYNWNVIYSSVLFSDQYKTQIYRSRFGALTITYQF